MKSIYAKANSGHYWTFFLYMKFKDFSPIVFIRNRGMLSEVAA